MDKHVFYMNGTIIVPELKITMEDTYNDRVSIALNCTKNLAVVGDVVWSTNLSDDMVEIVDNILTLKSHYEGDIEITATAYNASDVKIIHVACDIEGVTTYSCENIRQSKTEVEATETSIIVTFDCVATTTYENEHKETQTQVLKQDVTHTVTFEENLTSEPVTRSGSFTCEHGTLIEWSVNQAGKEQGGDAAYVDLGLPSGLKWATCNIGASNPWEYGKYFQWGDTIGYTGDGAKAHSSWSTAPFNGGNNSYNADAFNAVSGTVCPNGVLALEYDAAHVNMGGNWHMPTREDIQELLNNTTNEWVTNYEGTGVNGRKFTSKINGNTLFIPASGYFYGGYFYDEGSYASLWSSSLGASNPDNAWRLYFNSDSCYVSSSYRYDGFCVRGVL